MTTLSAPARRVQTTVRKPRVKPARSIRLVIAPSPISAGVVCISIGNKPQDYFVNEVEGVSFGRGFLVEKIGHEESYHVNIDGNNRTCECAGFLGNGRSNNGGRCKHADGLAALIAAGKL
jgi:hypothetical protein